jgi:hypothetical protein
MILRSLMRSRFEELIVVSWPWVVISQRGKHVTN